MPHPYVSLALVSLLFGAIALAAAIDARIAATLVGTIAAGGLLYLRRRPSGPGTASFAVTRSRRTTTSRERRPRR